MDRNSNGYSTELIIPEAKLYRLSDKSSSASWWKDAPAWTGRLTITDVLTHFMLEFHADGVTFGRTHVHEHPSHIICTLASSQKRFTILLDTDNGHNVMYGLALTDKSDATDLLSVLMRVHELKQRHLNSNAAKSRGSRSSGGESGGDSEASGFYVNYTQSVAMLTNTIKKYDTIFQNFVNAFNKDLDALISIDPANKDHYKKADAFRPNETEKEKDPKEKQKDQKEKQKEKDKLKEKDRDRESETSSGDNKKKRNANLAELSMHHDDENDMDADQDGEGQEVTKPSKLKKKTSKKAKKVKKVKGEKSDECENFKEPASVDPAPLQTITETLSSTHTKDAPVTLKSSKIHNIQEMFTKTPRVALTPLKNVSRYLESVSKEPQQSDAGDASLGPITRGKVKQMASCMEQKIKALKTSCYTHATNSSQQAPPTPATQPPASSKIARVNPQKFRSSIDKRKLRSSQAKTEIKRKSVKQVHAFIKGITNMAAKNASSMVANSTITLQEVVCLDATTDVVRPGDVGDVTMSEDKTMRTNVVKELLSNTMVQNQYRVTTQLKSGVHASSKMPERKKSFIKFLERNTPCKMSRTETDERRKMELQCKEKKELERLEERDKAKQEKIETAKKKREEKMKKIIEQKAKRLEDDQKRREEIEAKQREIDENKKRMAEEKKKEEQRLRDQKIADDKRRYEEQQQQQKAAAMPPVPGSTIKPKVAPHHDSSKYGYAASAMSSGYESLIHASNSSKLTYTSSNCSDKSTISGNKNIPVAKPMHNSAASGLGKPLETTYILHTPGKPAVSKPLFGKSTNLASHVLNNNAQQNQVINQSYPVTPLQEPVYKLKNAENYDVSDLKSDDETDDEEEPSKPIPPWAKDSALMIKAKDQCMKKINYTKIFKTASTYEIKLDEIFRTRRKKFTERSSSANWTTPPIWATGLNGEESFRLLYK